MRSGNERIDTLLAKVRGPAVLDVGCTGGSVPRTPAEEKHCLHIQLCHSFRTADILGTDINPRAAQEMAERGCRVVVSDAQSMDLGVRFDTILAGELIEHLSNPGLFLEQCLNHLKPDGLLILSTPNPFSVMHFLMYLKNSGRASSPEHALWLCPQTLTQLVARHHLRVTELCFVDDLRPEVTASPWYRAFALCYRLARRFLPKRYRNTIVAVCQPA